MISLLFSLMLVYCGAVIVAAQVWGFYAFAIGVALPFWIVMLVLPALGPWKKP